MKKMKCFHTCGLKHWRVNPMHKAQAMKDMAESHRETVEELEDHLRIANQYVKKEREINLKLMKQNERYRKSLETIFNESLEFSGYEDLDVHNPELFQFAFAVNVESQQALEDES